MIEFLFFFFACSCPALPSPFVEEATFIPFYTAAPFVILNINTEVSGTHLDPSHTVTQIKSLSLFLLFVGSLVCFPLMPQWVHTLLFTRHVNIPEDSKIFYQNIVSQDVQLHFISHSLEAECSWVDHCGNKPLPSSPHPSLFYLLQQPIYRKCLYLIKITSHLSLKHLLSEPRILETRYSFEWGFLLYW